MSSMLLKIKETRHYARLHDSCDSNPADQLSRGKNQIALAQMGSLRYNRSIAE